MIVAALATIPQRERELGIALRSLRPQVDALYVCLNGYGSVPAVVTECATDHARRNDEMGDAGKFLWADKVEADWLFTCDDDFEYGQSYVKHMVAAANRLQGRAAVSLHGVVLADALARGERMNWLREGRKRMISTIQSIEEDVPVHIAGTGVLCYPGGLLKLSLDDFPVSNMADVWFARACARQGVPRYAAAHEPGLVTPIAPPCPTGPRVRRHGGDYARYIAEGGPWKLMT